MTSTFMTMHHSVHSMSTSATTMSTYGINYFNDAYSSGECSDGYQSSISPVASPSLGHHYNYNPEASGYAASYSPKKNYSSYENECSYYQQTATNFTSTSCSFKSAPNQVDYSQNSYKLNVEIKPYSKNLEPQTNIKAPAPTKLSKVNRFVQQFNQQHENLSKQLMEHQDQQLIESGLVAPPPEILKKRRVAANARERRRMNNLNFAFDR